MSDGTREARTAAQWWADQLTANPDPNLGNPQGEVFAMWARSVSKKAPPTPKQVEVFREHLERTILTDMVGRDGWREAVEKGEPQWAAAFRTIATDYGPDRILGEALDAAGITSSSIGPLPLKTCMKVNPGRVVVGLGYGSPFEEIALCGEGTLGE